MIRAGRCTFYRLERLLEIKRLEFQLNRQEISARILHFINYYWLYFCFNSLFFICQNNKCQQKKLQKKRNLKSKLIIVREMFLKVYFLVGFFQLSNSFQSKSMCFNIKIQNALLCSNTWDKSTLKNMTFKEQKRD